ncbi:Uncharacterised protein [Mycobacteroides abscessus subsp. abscessus]|nr:Uncharacterised protein [Mycobacteroides abscessus subsp. abscessus]
MGIEQVCYLCKDEDRNQCCKVRHHLKNQKRGKSIFPADKAVP